MTPKARLLVLLAFSVCCLGAVLAWRHLSTAPVSTMDEVDHLDTGLSRRAVEERMRSIGYVQ